MKKSVSQQLLDYLTQNPGVHPSGLLQRMEFTNADGRVVTPQTVGRELRRLAELGEIHVELRQNHAHYSSERIAQKPKIIIRIVETPNGPVAMRIEEGV